IPSLAGPRLCPHHHAASYPPRGFHVLRDAHLFPADVRKLHRLDPPCDRRVHDLHRQPDHPPHRGDRGLAMSTTMILAFGVAVGVLMIFIGLARTPSSNTALNVQQRLAAYGGEKPLTVEEIELQRPFSERVLRPSIE